MATDAQTLLGRTVLITGAARGIGAATARQCAARGARVALVGLEPERLEALAAELGPRAAAFAADVRDAAELATAVDRALARFGGIDVVVANAGIGRGGPIDQVTDAEFAGIVDVNLLGVWRTVRLTLPHLAARRGYLLLIASMAAVFPPPQLTAYSAAKAGVEAIGDSLRVELRPRGVGVGVAYFGFIDTDMVRAGFADNPGLEQQVRRGVLRLLPVEAAAAAIVRGIERRSRRVVVPRVAYPAVLVARLIRPLIDRGLGRAAAELVAAPPAAAVIPPERG